MGMRKLFSSRNQVLDLLKQANFHTDTAGLLSDVAQLRKERNPFFLTSMDFDRILKWKLRAQFSRQQKSRKQNTDQNIRIITACAFELSHTDPYQELKLKVDTLMILYGVGIPVASSILAVVYPESYAVLDFRNWRQLFPEDRVSAFSNSHYGRYMQEIRQMADYFKVKPQEIDLAIWQNDMSSMSK